MTAAMSRESYDAVMANNLIGRAGKPKASRVATPTSGSDHASFVTGHMRDINGGKAF